MMMAKKACFFGANNSSTIILTSESSKSELFCKDRKGYNYIAQFLETTLDSICC